MARARHLSTQARDPAPWYEHTEIGYNYRLSNILAALGVAQLERLDGMIARRGAIRDHYANAFGDIPQLRILGRNGAGSDATDNQWLTPVVLPPGVDPGLLINDLEARNIEARHLWKPMHLQPVHAFRRTFTNGVSEELFDRGVSLPSGSALSDGDIERVVAAVQDSIAAQRRTEVGTRA